MRISNRVFAPRESVIPLLLFFPLFLFPSLPSLRYSRVYPRGRGRECSSRANYPPKCARFPRPGRRREGSRVRIIESLIKLCRHCHATMPDAKAVSAKARLLQREECSSRRTCEDAGRRRRFSREKETAGFRFSKKGAPLRRARRRVSVRGPGRT